MIFAKYTDDYYSFLKSGDISKKPFLVMEEYGKYTLTNPESFSKLATVIAALQMFLEDLGKLPSA